jgi:GNAT superfamily N-acetyltransferase
MIRKATTEDLEAVRKWLQQENDDGHHSFIVNMSMIEDGQRDGSLTVLVDKELPVAFVLGEQNLAILAVKQDRRSGGIGRKLATNWFEQARERDLIGFDGECSPSSSLSFWKKMGCTQIKSQNHNPWVIMPFRKTHDLPDGVGTVRLSFELHDDDKKAIPGWEIVNAAIIENDDYMLAQDFVAYVPDYNTRLTVWADGLAIRSTKVTHIQDIDGECYGSWIRVRNLPSR